MGILSTEQANKIRVKSISSNVLAIEVERKQSKRIYIVPKKQEKKFAKVKAFSQNRMVFCKVCYKRIGASDAVEVIGGSEQGHKNFWMCREHM